MPSKADAPLDERLASAGGSPVAPEIERAVRAVLLDGVGIGITVQDRAGRLVYANAVAARIMGFPSADALCAIDVGEAVGRFELYRPDGRPLTPNDLPSRVAFAGHASAEQLVRFRPRQTQEEHWTVVRALPIADGSGNVAHVINVFREVSDQTREDANRRFLLRADQQLTASLDYESTLTAVAWSAVPVIADWCTVDLVDGDKIKRVAVAHIDPAKIELVQEMERRYPADPNAPASVQSIIRSGQPSFIPEIPRQMLTAAAVDAEHLRLIEELRLRSYISVPLTVRGKTFGVLTLAMAESGRFYSQKDLEFAQALADRAALAIENARLLQDARRELASTEERFQLMVESVKDYAIFMLDPGGHVATWNAGAQLIKGYRADEIIGQHFSRFYPVEVAQSGHCERELEIAAREGRYEEEGWRVRKDGSRFWATVVITALRDEKGALRGFAKVTRDLTEHRRNDEMRETYRMMIEGVRDYAIFMLDPKGYVATWNAGAQLIKGYSEEEIVGQHFSRFYPEDVARSGHCENELAIAAREGRYEEEGWRVRKDGSRFWASVVITAVRDERGELKGFTKVTRDLSERKRAEEALKAEMNRRLDAEQTSRLAQLFVGVLGHDLRNPLNAIITGASYLSRIATSEKQNRTVARITASGQRMAAMIEQLLDFTRFGIGGGIPLDCKRGDLADICQNVVDELTAAHQDRAIRCDFIGDTAGSWDLVRIEQAISNLVGNAVQHGERASPVSLRLDGRGSRVLLTLHNGGAIAPELLPKLFTPFKRVRKGPATSASSGLGLGLYISHQIIQAHAGDLQVRSSHEDGTTFVVSLPRNCPPSANPSENGTWRRSS